MRVADVGLPGKATRFDYQDIDAAHGHLIARVRTGKAPDGVGWIQRIESSRWCSRTVSSLRTSGQQWRGS